MAFPTDDRSAALSRDLLHALDDLNGLHPGFRPAHAKGILLAGVFTPSSGAASLTRAPHAGRKSTPVTVRFSNSAGFPAVADNDPNFAGPRGIAIRFHLAEHVHTDIIGHSTDGFPARTPEEFLEFLRSIHSSGPDAPKPSPLEAFLGAHPKALVFVQTPKPIPTSFLKESYFTVTAFKFTGNDGNSRYGRFRVRPEGGNEYLDAPVAAAKGANFLMEEITERITKGPARLNISVQVATGADTVDDSTVHWPEDRPQVEFGVVELNGVIPEGDREQHKIIFDPIPRVDGIEPSGDPLLDVRASLYLLSGRRRRAAGGA
jgi:catalase